MHSRIKNPTAVQNICESLPAGTVDSRQALDASIAQTTKRSDMPKRIGILEQQRALGLATSKRYYLDKSKRVSQSLNSWA